MNRFSQLFERTMQRRYWSRRQFFRSFAVLWVLLTVTCIAGAQTNTATLSGTVLDSQGAVVPDVAITISSRATGLKRQTTTNSEGLFTLPLLPPGIYSLQAQREGFSPVEVQDIELPVAGQVSQDVVLQVSGITHQSVFRFVRSTLIYFHPNSKDWS